MKRKYTRRDKVPASTPPVEKALTSPPVDTMVKNDNICKQCGRKMLSVRCQCGWVRPINKIME